jgi:F-type H+-transporting ATPase subunit b
MDLLKSIWENELTQLVIDSDLINFTIAAAAVIYLLMKVIPESTAKRKTEIQKELLKAQEAKKDAETKLKELEIAIEDAKKETITIIQTAKENADAVKKQTMSEAKIEIDRLNTNAHREIEMHKEMAINTIKEQITHLTMKNVEKSLIEKKDELDKLIKAKLKNDLKEQVA